MRQLLRERGVRELTDCSVEVDVRGLEEATNAKYWITFFVFSVFPAPLSPLHHRNRHKEGLIEHMQQAA